MEVCVDSVVSAINAEHGGMLRVIKQCASIPVFVMIRPRGGDFLYSDEEYSVMKEEITALKKDGADGFVFGILNGNGTVDVPRNKELIKLCRPKPVTFHRAIDMTRDITEAVESIISLGFDRILTSGGECTAVAGLAVIKTMIKQAKGRTVIMPGGGINPENLNVILESSGVIEFHGTARKMVESKMEYRKSSVPMGAPSCGLDEFAWKETSAEIVQKLVKMYNSRAV